MSNFRDIISEYRFAPKTDKFTLLGESQMNRSTDLYVDGKRHILVADDEMINREMLENILCDEYDVLMAEDGGRL